VVTAPQNRTDPQGQDPTTTSPGGESDRWGTRPKVPRSRMGEAWVALLVAAFVLLLLLVFILQNGQQAEVSFLGAHAHLPMGVALLLAAIFGVLLVALPGTARIIQLRMLSRRRANNAATRPSPPEPSPPEPTPPAAAPDDPPGT
jgi:uncharacterized integral membrane protein